MRLTALAALVIFAWPVPSVIAHRSHDPVILGRYALDWFAFGLAYLLFVIGLVAASIWLWRAIQRGAPARWVESMRPFYRRPWLVVLALATSAIIGSLVWDAFLDRTSAAQMAGMEQAIRFGPMVLGIMLLALYDWSPLPAPAGVEQPALQPHRHEHRGREHYTRSYILRFAALAALVVFAWPVPGIFQHTSDTPSILGLYSPGWMAFGLAYLFLVAGVITSGAILWLPGWQRRVEWLAKRLRGLYERPWLLDLVVSAHLLGGTIAWQLFLDRGSTAQVPGLETAIRLGPAVLAVALVYLWEWPQPPEIIALLGILQLARKGESLYSHLPSLVRGAIGPALILALSTVIALSLGDRLTEQPNSRDSAENLAGAYNLAYHGVISLSGDFGHYLTPSLDPEANLEPSNYREPLPIVFLAAHIKLHPVLSSGLTRETINEGAAVVAVKQHNLFWAFLCLVGVASTTLAAVRPRLAGTLAAAIAAHLTYLFFLQNAIVIDRTNTEVQAGTLLVWLSFALIRSLRTGRPVWFVLSGVLLGGLALTKAAFLYIGLGLIVALLLVYLIKKAEWGRWRAAGLVGLIAIPMVVMTAPWMIRNMVLFGSFEITQRAGLNLIHRAYHNQMNDVEYAGAFYHFAPWALRPSIGDYLGFSPRDFDEGGRLQRLYQPGTTIANRDLEAARAGRPEDTIAFYRSSWAEWVRLRNMYRDQGADNPVHLADRDLRRQAMSLIMANPLQHLRASILFMWRGMWAMQSETVAPAATWRLNALAFLVIWMMALVGLARRNAEMIGIALPSVGALTLYALTTEFLPRFGAVTVPNMMIAITATGAWIVVWLFSLGYQKSHKAVRRFLARIGDTPSPAAH